MWSEHGPAYDEPNVLRVRPDDLEAVGVYWQALRDQQQGKADSEALAY